MSQPTSFEDFLSLKQIDTNQYVSKWPTESNSFNPKEKFAYGGCILAFGIKVGYATVKSTYTVYSCLGAFLGPALAGKNLRAIVTAVQDTRTFATRRVEVFQDQEDKTQVIASMQLHFQTPEERSLLTYSAAPSREYSSPESSWTEADMRLYARNRGVTEKTLRVLDGAMGSRKRYFDTRCPPESPSADTLHGLIPDIGTAQKQCSITDMTTCYYWTSLSPLRSHGE